MNMIEHEDLDELRSFGDSSPDDQNSGVVKVRALYLTNGMVQVIIFLWDGWLKHHMIMNL